MLAWIVLLVIVGYLMACATFLIGSCYQLVKLFINWTPKKHRPMPRPIEV